MSKINYDALAVDGLKDVLIQVSTTCKELGIDFFIVGAIARNIWLASNGENPTGTKDIDFGIYVPNENQFDSLKGALTEKYKYTQSAENECCLITQNGKQIDLMPFGLIEKDGQVSIEGKGLTKLNLEGFEEAFNLGATEVKIGEESYKTCSIPAIVILKMVAFDDRPEHRIKDIKDINLICRYYPQIESNLIWDKHFDLYENDRDHNEVAMIVLGRQMRVILADNTALHNRIITILDQAIDQQSGFLLHMIEDYEKENLEMKAKLLEHIKQGLTELAFPLLTK